MQELKGSCLEEEEWGPKWRRGERRESLVHSLQIAASFLKLLWRLQSFQIKQNCAAFINSFMYLKFDNTFCTMRRQKRIKLIHKPSVLCEAMSAYCKYNMHVNMVIIACTHLWVQQQMLKGRQGKQKQQQVLAEGTQAHCHQKNQSARSWPVLGSN